MTVLRTDCFDQSGQLERPRYFDHQLLTADDLLAEQEYFRHRLMRHNRFLHGWGVVCGLHVCAETTGELPWRVRLDPGYALGPFGHEIHVPSATYLDLALCGLGAATDPCDPALLHTPAQTSGGGEVFVAIRYAECVSRPMRVLPDGCGCAEETCEFSRVRSSFVITCLPGLPASHQPPNGPSLCNIARGDALPPCPSCPAEPWVVLAQVTLPAAATVAITSDHIDDSSFRRQVFSTAALQTELIACCCDTSFLANLQITMEQQRLPVTVKDTKVAAKGAKEVLNYVIKVVNIGSTDARNTKVTATAAFVGDYQQAGPVRHVSGPWVGTDWPVTAQLGDLAPGQEKRLELAVGFVPGASADSGDIMNIATAVSDNTSVKLSQVSLNAVRPGKGTP